MTATRLLSAIGASLCGVGSVLFAADRIAPPPTAKEPVRDTYHGVEVTEDYRWLEDANNPDVQKWTDAQNQYTRSVLDRYPGLAGLRHRLRELLTDPSPTYSE